MALLLVGVTGCSQMSFGQPTASPYYAVVRVDSVVQGGGVKLNGMLAAPLPGELRIEVDADGKVARPYVVSLSTNILSPTGASGATADPTDRGSFVINPGDIPPERIHFSQQGPRATGQALVERVR